MENEQITHLVINHIKVKNDEITIGATDNLRWKWDIEEGMTGADAKTIVWVCLKGKTEENAGFHCSPGDPVRKLAMSYLFEMFAIAWEIKYQKDDILTARKKYFGMELKTKIVTNA